MTLSVPATGSRRAGLVTALGVTQILAWGSSYYLPAVLAQPIAADTGWPLPWIVGGLSIGLFVAGLCAPAIGRAIQERGGRPILAASSVLLAAALAWLAFSSSLVLFLAGWVVMGVGMSAGLYDAGFATLGRLYGREARSSITTLTLFGGFASTVCWPLSAFLVESFGWRTACLVYAAVHLLLALPLHLIAVPALGSAASSKEGDGVTVPKVPSDVPPRPWAFALLASILVMAALVASTLSVHLLGLLQLRGYDLAGAVALGALIGPSQVGARAIEMLLGRRYHPAWTMLASVVLIAAGVGLLLTGFLVPALALICYGAGNGLHTIARGALPLVLFDPAHYAAFIGKLAFPSLLVQAVAPAAGAWLLPGDGSLMLTVLAAVAVLNVLCGLTLWRTARH